MSPFTMLRVVLVSMALVITTWPAAAHEIRPTIGDISVTQTNATLSLRLALEALVADIDLGAVNDTNDAPEAALYDRLRAMAPADLEAAFRAAWPRISDGFIIELNGTRLTPEIVSVDIPETGDTDLPRDSFLTIAADLPPGDAGVRVGLSPALGTFIPRQVGGGEDAYEGFLDGGELTPALPRAEVLTEGAGAVFLRYIVAGFDHIIPKGLDHILFVLGLFFFSMHIRPLLFQVTAFTLAHTITLALASTGVVSVPASVVEPLIAASIVYVGIENTLGRGNMRARTALVFAFGLLHGLGFASVLGDFGIATERFGWALAGFNIGVELGQLAVIAGAFLTVGLWFGKKEFYRPLIAVPASLAIAAVGAYWVVERTLL
ncbi:HupE/UreJ family protein [Rhodophyticola porphyridii]|uniref:HupE/UreJ family protein n=2 Tax=Rhodophyticola porphyridii TaxID=1852017 RepID=A0A3L9Y8G2_9RHOB|nr:HupE/UreJ family protein [Rhodophyticola porphyridii]